MELFESLCNTYADYIRTANALEVNRKPGDGLFGLGADPKKDSCHLQFYEQVGKLIEDAFPVSPEEAARSAEFILHSEERFPEPELCKGMMVAAHRHAIALIPSLNREDAGALLRWYQDYYPRFQRFPVHQEVLRALKERVGAVGFGRKKR